MSEPSNTSSGLSGLLPTSSSSTSTSPAAPTAGPAPTPATTSASSSTPTLGSAPSSDSFDFNLPSGPKVDFRPKAKLPTRSLASRLAGKSAAGVTSPPPRSPAGEPAVQAPSLSAGQGFVAPSAFSSPTPYVSTEVYNQLKARCDSQGLELQDKTGAIALLRKERDSLEKQLREAQEGHARELEAQQQRVRQELETRFRSEQEALLKRVLAEQEARYVPELDALGRRLMEETGALTLDLQKKEEECAALRKKAADDKTRFDTERDALSQRLRDETTALGDQLRDTSRRLSEREAQNQALVSETATLANELQTKEQDFTTLLAAKLALEKQVADLESTRQTRSEREDDLDDEVARLRIRLALTEADKEMAEQAVERRGRDVDDLQSFILGLEVQLGEEIDLLKLERDSLIRALAAERDITNVDEWLWVEAVPAPKGVSWLWFVGFLLAALLAIFFLFPALFWAMGWLEDAGAFGFGGPDFDNTFSRLVATFFIYCDEFLLL